MEINFPKLEKKILKFWKENRTFEKSVEQRAKARNFVFYEGPPTANAKPGIHHVLSRVYKDIICRYKTMQGFRVLRKAGWDTHGLPVELEIEKKLGLKSKKDIEKYGIAKFNKLCKESVWNYKKDWEKLTKRIAFWLDMENPYITYEPEYIESVWWIIKEIYKKGLLYQGYKVVPYCPRCIDGNSKILTNPGLSKPIKELKNYWKENKVVALDAENNRITTASINEFIALQEESTLKLSTGETRRSIVATADHPFWVKGGGWVPLEKINIGDKVAVYPYFEISEDRPKGKKILNEKNLQAILTDIELKRGKKRTKQCPYYENLISIDKWKIDKKIRAFRKKSYTFREIQKKIFSKYKLKISLNAIHQIKNEKKRNLTLEYIIQELTDKGLLPLTTKNPKLLIVARLLGHIFGDGFLMMTSGKRINLATGFTGKENDLNDIRNDLDELGFSYEPIRKRFVSSILKDRTIQGYSTEFRVNSISLATLLIALGAPIGKKSETCYGVPKWLFKTPKHIIREFLASYFGSELNKIKIYQRRTFDTLRFSLNKDENLIKNGVHFIKEIAKLLKKFDVEIKEIRFGLPFIKKNGRKSIKIRAIFLGSNDNLLNFCKFVGYRYSKERENFALYVREYLELRKILEKKKIQKYQKILKLREKGLSSKEISQAFNIKTERINEILNRKSKKDVRIRDIPEFKNWLKDTTEGLPEGVVWETVGKIEKMGKRNVFDFNVDKLHSFIVNGFVTHNCGTSLSSHEVALGYEKIKEPAIYVKLKVKSQKLKTGTKTYNLKSNTYLLVWTTTPWTLPGNVAVAANPKFTYVKAKVGKEIFILAKKRLDVLGQKYEIIKEIKGKDLLGLEYEPLYKFVKPDKKTWFVIPADFVSLEEGTGLVHIAPAFGEDDMEVGKEKNLPVLMTIDETGCFIPKVKQWSGMFVKKADPLIIEDLRKRNLLFKDELYEHDYPFCWRCDSPLLYYAKQSWFINVRKVKKNLIGNNQRINWVPAHLKKGRFGEWLREIKDWAFSRERYWGTPLPIWQCKKCGKTEVIGSKKDLLSQEFNKNEYFILRHGESLKNVKDIAVSWPEKFYSPLTKKGEKQVRRAVKEIKKKKINLIFSSDLLRTKQTAGIIGKELGIKPKFDKRLRELDMGKLNGKLVKEAGRFWDPERKLSRMEYYLKRFETRAPGGENYLDAEKRMYSFLKDIEKRHKNKTVLIIGHELPLTMLEGVVKGFSREEIIRYRDNNQIEVGWLRKLDFKILPYNQEGELDFHRPFIDEVKFHCPKCESLMERVSEVIDCWFDSGSMPFAQYHYPFEKQKFIDEKEQFPADYISEAVDQTRGWFYTLHAISTLLNKGLAYKNVISLGHVLDEKGEKMSKSKGNVIEPDSIIEKYGADTTRWYFYTVNKPGDPKLFSKKDVEQTLKKIILTLWNSYLFFETYAKKSKTRNPKSKNVLDKWVISKLNNLIKEVTQRLDSYDITGAGRAIENFTIEDLSQWYIRRSRKRFQKPQTKKELREASKTLGFVLINLSKLMAPFVPFISEEIYQNLAENCSLSSVHLEDWPKVNKKLINEKLEKKMVRVREIVNLGLKERARLGLKVRQPLREIAVGNLADGLDKELKDLIREELNVKGFRYDLELKEKIKLDERVTVELREEGIVREVIRNIQGMRKKAKLKPKDKIWVRYSGTPDLNKILSRNKKYILKEAKVKDLILGEKPKQVFDVEMEIKVDQKKLWLAIRKI